jgi:BMFP domain-containing protein YqiC
MRLGSRNACVKLLQEDNTMINSEQLQKISEDLSGRLAGLPQPPGASLLKGMVREAVARLDLVTREDYERLLEIHQRTRQKLDELARRVEALEQVQQPGR